MIRYILSGLRLPFGAPQEEFFRLARRMLGLPSDTPAALYRRSVDLRHNTLSAVCAVELSVPEERPMPERPDLRVRAKPALAEVTAEQVSAHPPVVVGFGPAGLFAALALARRGYRPVVLERGPSLDARDRAVQRFWDTGALDADGNIQFGEGGAGAYSDGKLNTRIGDPRCELVLQWLEEHGAPHEALLAARPHVGTDLLKPIVRSIREEILALGGEVRFGCRVTGLRLSDGRLAGLTTAQGGLPCETAVLAIGHSARDSFTALHAQGIVMERKPFSVGVRIEHLQSAIDRALYGRFCGTPGLPVGEYVLSVQTPLRKCYSFCMCPGGQVVAAASEEGGVVTNGMSTHDRAGHNANAALCVPVDGQDFEGGDPLAGMRFQRLLEQAAFGAGDGAYRAPCQTVGDFLNDTSGHAPTTVQPTYARGVEMCDLASVLPPAVTGTLRGALPLLGRKLRGFDDSAALLTGVETRTSSPVRIVRGERMESLSAEGLIPCGEGAGYAGGIVSAAVDGLRAAEAVFSKYRPRE